MTGTNIAILPTGLSLTAKHPKVIPHISVIALRAHRTANALLKHCRRINCKED
jgi:hypothetical protein